MDRKLRFLKYLETCIFLGFSARFFWDLHFSLYPQCNDMNTRRRHCRASQSDQTDTVLQKQNGHDLLLVSVGGCLAIWLLALYDDLLVRSGSDPEGEREIQMNNWEKLTAHILVSFIIRASKSKESNHCYYSETYRQKSKSCRIQQSINQPIF